VAPPSEKTQLEFLAYIQRLLDEGEFTATYKYALLMALADLAVERGDDGGGPLTLGIRDIAGKFVRYYWRQARPYVNGPEQGMLHQNTGAQARIVNLVRDAAAATPQTAEAPYHVSGPESPLVREVAQTVRVMPLWKLQILNGHLEAVLYPHTMSRDVVVLNPGVAFCFRRFHGLVTRLAQDAWIRFVRNRPANQSVLGEAVDLGAFLFGSERANLELYRPLLVDLQGNTCFYCATSLRQGDVDHFIPWSRYPHDLGHNFVLACAPCNHGKRDMLADHRHRERWLRRNDDRGSEISAWCELRRLPHDLAGITTVAAWAYAQAEAAGSRFWPVR
jgi:hypothetical protein